MWQANKDFEDNPFGENAERLPNKPHGLNGYSSINNIAFLSSLNPPTGHFKFLDAIGLDGAEVRQAIYFAGAYQSIMRTSLRNPDNCQPKRIVVPDRALAEYLHRIFPGSKIERLNVGLPEVEAKKPGRPRRHKSNRDRVAEWRRKDKEKRVEILAGLFRLRFGPNALAWECCNENTIIRLYTDFVTQPCLGTLYSEKTSKISAAYVAGSNINSFVDFLRQWHLRRADFKEQIPLISPAVFDPSLSEETSRGLGNIVFVQNLWLDFEKGKLFPDEIPRLFPYTRMIVTNTFHHTSNNPRFRVIIPTSQPLTPEAYEFLIDNIVHKIEDAGYRVDRGKANKISRSNCLKPPSGLDWGKRTPASLFFLPTQAENPTESFFRDYAGPERQNLDPVLWIQNSVVRVRPKGTVQLSNRAQPAKIDEARLRAAIDKWRQSPFYPQQGNDRFFEFALDLRRAGMNVTEIEATLRMEALNGRSPKERRAQIPSIITSLRNSGRRSY